MYNTNKTNPGVVNTIKLCRFLEYEALSRLHSIHIQENY
jgi:hypothetical protein